MERASSKTETILGATRAFPMEKDRYQAFHRCISFVEYDLLQLLLNYKQTWCFHYS